MGLIFKALDEQKISLLDAIIDISSSTLFFTTDSVGGDKIKIKGPPTHLKDHGEKFKASNSEIWIEEGFFWSSKPQLTVQEIIYKKITRPDLIHSIVFV